MHDVVQVAVDERAFRNVATLMEDMIPSPQLSSYNDRPTMITVSAVVSRITFDCRMFAQRCTSCATAWQYGSCERTLWSNFESDHLD